MPAGGGGGGAERKKGDKNVLGWRVVMPSWNPTGRQHLQSRGVPAEGPAGGSAGSVRE